MLSQAGGGGDPCHWRVLGLFGPTCSGFLCNTQNLRGCCLGSYLFIKAVGLYGLSDLTVSFTQLTATEVTPKVLENLRYVNS